MARIKRYLRYLKHIVKLIAAYIAVHVFRRGLLREDLWLVQEKHTEARDNGYHFYAYLREKHPELHAYYVIVKGSPDEEKIKKYGPPIAAESFSHCMYWIAAKYSVNSQPYGACPYPTNISYRFRSLCRKDQKTVYLKHGIYKDELAHDLDYANTHFSLVCCAAKIEQEFIQKTYGYPPNVAQLLGLCRFDRLAKAEPPKKQILVMPTFRKWLKAEKIEFDATDAECARFRESDFYRNYETLLTDERLLSAARARGYSIVFYLHYSLQSYRKAFLPFQNSAVVIADRQHYDVQRLMMESAVMVTDFSSVFFDFAYMKRPEIFFQFDEAVFRKDHYKTGYFDYRRDAFGPVYTAPEEVTNELIRLLGEGCAPRKEYLDKAARFFAFFDSGNCERTYNAIRQLG